MDSLVGVPLLVAAGISALVFITLLIAKLRNTAKISFIFFLISGVLVAGCLYTYYNQQLMFLVFTLAFAEVLILLYTGVVAFSNPKKREEKKEAKRLAEQRAMISENSVSKEEYNATVKKYKRIIEVNKDLVAKVSSFFSTEDSMEGFLNYGNKLLTEKVKADGCVILMADDFDNILTVKSFTGSFPPPYKLPADLPHKPIRVETNLRFAQFPLTDNIFGDIAVKGEPVLIEDSVRDPRVYQNGPEDFLKCGSYIFIPIKQAEGVAGVIALSRDPGKAKFTKEDVIEAEVYTDAIASAMKPLYSFLSYAEHKELTSGGDIATSIQKTLIPSKLPAIASLGIGCFTNPMENVCGDYYDVIISRKNRISFIMADVAGKGMNSLVVMLMIRAILRLTVNTPQSAATILAWANRGICIESSKIDHFASVALINYDSETKKAEIASCGNNPVLLYSAKTKSLDTLTDVSEPMGVEKDSVYKDVTVTLEKGDMIVTFTDGIVEALNDMGAQYSMNSLSKIITANAGKSAKEISSRVKDDLKKFCDGTQQFDDQSLLVIKAE